MTRTGEIRVEAIKQGLADSNTIKERDNTILELEKVLSDTANELDQFKNKYNNLISFLSDYLLNKTNNVYKEEKQIKAQLDNLIVANTEPIDNVLIINEYISKVERAGILIRPIDIPDDIANGYWNLVNGKYILDKEKYAQMWSVI